MTWNLNFFGPQPFRFHGTLNDHDLAIFLVELDPVLNPFIYKSMQHELDGIIFGNTVPHWCPFMLSEIFFKGFIHICDSLTLQQEPVRLHSFVATAIWGKIWKYLWLHQVEIPADIDHMLDTWQPKA